MTFPSTLKKSGPITISKTGSGSKVSPGSPRSPGSPLSIPVKKIVSGSSVKAPPANKILEKTPTTAVTTLLKKVVVSTKSPPLKSAIKSVVDVKSEPEKTAVTATKRVTKSVIKPPPLKLNMKVIDANGLQSPVTPKSPLKSVPKTPTTPSTKKSMTNNSVLTAKSTSLLGVKSPPSSPLVKPSKVSTVSLVTEFQEVKSTSSKKSSALSSPKISGLSKASAVSMPVAKSLTLAISKTSKIITTAPKSPVASTRLLAPTVKSVVSKTAVKENSLLLPLVQSKAIIVKPTIPVKKAGVVSNKNVIGIKLSSTENKSSSSTVSSTKAVPLKSPSSSKLLTKESSAVKIARNSTIAVNKSSVVSKLEPASPKVILNKETSTFLSVKSTSLIKSTSVLKSATSKAKVTSSLVSKNSAPKSPITITKPSSPTVKTSPLPIVKTPMSPIVKTRTPLSPLSPIVRPRTTSTSSTKPPMSPARPKLLPTKLVLSPTKSKLSSSRHNSISIESLTSRTSLKSPMSAKSMEFATKSPSKVIKKTEAPTAKSIRGGQPIQKTTIIPDINESSSDKVLNKTETSDVCKLENVIENTSEEVIESAVSLTSTPNPLFLKPIKINETEVHIEDDLKTNYIFVHDDVFLNETNGDNVEKLLDVQNQSVGTKEEVAVVVCPSITIPDEQIHDEISSSFLGFEVVTKDECMPCINSISQSANNCSIEFEELHFDSTNDNIEEQQSIDVDESEDNFETMNDKLVLGDVLSDISDCEQGSQKEPIETKISDKEVQHRCVGDVFSFTSTEDISINDHTRADSIDNFIHQFMPSLADRSEGASSISTDDGSLYSRKSYSEAVAGSPNKDGEFYFEFDFDMADDCLDYDDELPVFVEVTEKEFPELKPKDLSRKRKNKKQKKKNNSHRTESSSDTNSLSEEINYNPKDFEGNEFCHYVKMMKDCSFYPSGLFSSDSVKLSKSSLSWLDISVRTTDDNLVPSTDSLSTYEIFQASNLNKDFLTSVINCNTASNSTVNESSWSWKSIESRHQSHIKTNITLSLQPRPADLNTPRFMLLLALISEAKGYEILPLLSENFVTTDCMPRFDVKIRRLMVEGFWLVGRLIKESLSKDEETNCGNPFEFADGDIGFWWAGISMLDWQEHLKGCGKNQVLNNCYQFVLENIDGKHSSEALLSMNSKTPEEFMSEADVENFIHTVRSVKYYCGNCFVDSEENIEKTSEHGCNDDNDLNDWGSSSATQEY